MTPASPSRARLTDRSFVLALLTLVLLTPPIITIFDVPIFIFGVPLLHVYCFGLWLAAIIVGGILSARIAARGTIPVDEQGSSGRDRG